MESENKTEIGVNTDELEPAELQKLVDNNKELWAENDISNIGKVNGNGDTLNETSIVNNNDNNDNYENDENDGNDGKNINENNENNLNDMKNPDSKKDTKTFSTEIQISQRCRKDLLHEMEEKE